MPWKSQKYLFTFCCVLLFSLPSYANWNFEFKNHFMGLGRCDDVAIADFNGDGKMDVVFSTGHIFINQGGYPYPQWKHLNNLFPESMGMWVGDFDADGDVDVVAPKKKGATYLVENQNGLGTQWKTHAIYTIGGNGEEARVIDLNGDQKEDIVLLKRNGGPLTYLQQPQSKPYQTWPNYQIGNQSNDEGAMDVADMDGDGDMDVYVIGYWYENPRGTNQNNWPVHHHPGSLHKSRVADMNGDGQIDIIDGHRVFFGPDFKSKSEAEKILQGTKLHACMPVDFDLDGDMDIMIGGYTGGPILYENRDGKALSWKTHQLPGEGYTHNAWCGDLNGDNKPDIVGKHFDKKKSGFDVWYNHIDNIETSIQILNLNIIRHDNYPPAHSLVYIHSKPFELSISVNGKRGYYE